MSISTGITALVILFAIGALLAARAAIRSFQSARTVVFHRTRRIRTLAGQRWLLAAFILSLSSAGFGLYGPSLANRIFPSNSDPLASTTLTSAAMHTPGQPAAGTDMSAPTQTALATLPTIPVFTPPETPVPTQPSEGTAVSTSSASTDAPVSDTPSRTFTPTPDENARATSAASTERRQVFIAALSATPTFTRTPIIWTLTPTNTPRPTWTPSPTRTPRPSATFSQTPTFTAIVITTPTSTWTATLRPTIVPTQTNTPIPTSTTRPMQTVTSTSAPTNTVTPTSTRTSIPTSTRTRTATPPPVNAAAVTFTASLQPTLTYTPSDGATSTVTTLPTNTAALTWTPSLTVTHTLAVTGSFTATATRTPTPTPNLGCDRIELIANLTVPNHSVLAPGSSFTKVWRLRNSGTCTWKSSYRVVLVSGDLMGGQPMLLPREIAPGETIDLAMNFKAPDIAGSYQGNWQIQNDKGELFGTSAAANRPFRVTIRVPSPGLTGSAYDFVANACSAQWFTGSGNIRCPGTNNDSAGFVRRLTTAHLEDGTTSTQPSLLTVPQDVLNGYIRGVYPSIRIQPGDRLQAMVGCEGNATSCDVLFRIDYQLADGILREFWAFGEQHDGNHFVVDLDLSPLAGQDVRFVFTVLTLGPSTGDRALWIEPRIVRGQ